MWDAVYIFYDIWWSVAEVMWEFLDTKNQNYQYQMAGTQSYAVTIVQHQFHIRLDHGYE